MPQIEECDQGHLCRNSVQAKGEGQSKCMLCRLAPGNENLSAHYWKPENGRLKHPALLREKFTKARERRTERIKQKRSADPIRKRVQRQAQRAEKSTERNIIKATKNSGRANRDGDHKAGGFITLDTKNQSLRDNPVVLLIELSKVRNDAMNAGNQIGGLVLRNRHNVGVVVFDEKDFARVFLGGDSGNGNQ